MLEQFIMKYIWGLVGKIVFEYHHLIRVLTLTRYLLEVLLENNYIALFIEILSC